MTIKERNGNLPDAITRIVKEKGLKKNYVAERANLTPMNLTDICAGRRLATITDVVRLAQALDVTPNDLIM